MPFSFNGVLAPHVRLRAAIVPIPAPTTTAHATDCEHAPGASARMSWARLLKRVFDIDIERCPRCGGNLKIIAAIEEPAVIERILTHLGSCAQPPPSTPARLVSVSGGLILERGPLCPEPMGGLGLRSCPRAH